MWGVVAAGAVIILIALAAKKPAEGDIAKAVKESGEGQGVGTVAIPISTPAQLAEVVREAAAQGIISMPIQLPYTTEPASVEIPSVEAAAEISQLTLEDWIVNYGFGITPPALMPSPQSVYEARIATAQEMEALGKTALAAMYYSLAEEVNPYPAAPIAAPIYVAPAPVVAEKKEIVTPEEYWTPGLTPEVRAAQLAEAAEWQRQLDEAGMY